MYDCNYDLNSNYVYTKKCAYRYDEKGEDMKSLFIKCPLLLYNILYTYTLILIITIL